ncbi:MAG: hypothetical protein SGILL_009672, partial [Bacillariaceae sp.]
MSTLEVSNGKAKLNCNRNDNLLDLCSPSQSRNMTASTTSISSSSKRNINHSDHSASSTSHSKPPPFSPSHSFSSRSVTHDPVPVVSLHQLEAFELLPSTPVWIFDFYGRKNIWANAAGLRMWNAPDVQEFVSRDMSDMSETARVRTQKLMDRAEQGHYVPEQWTFYPKGKAKTVQVKFSAVRLTPEEHCVLIGVGSTGATTRTTRSNGKKSSASSTASLGSSTNEDEEDLATLQDTEADEKSLESSKFHESMDSLPLHSLDHSTRISTIIEHIEEAESKCCDDDDDSSVEQDPVQQENLRVAEIIRYLPTAVCQFDVKGNLMYQNPAAYLPHIDDDCQESKEEEKIDDTENASTRSCFLRRFVDIEMAQGVLAKLTDESCSTIPSMSFEAELYTSEKSRTQWSGIQLRKALDPVTSEPVILFSSFDRSDAVEAERERKARIEESEFMAIMAHEIRTPLHQVTGFIDLLECSCVPKEKTNGCFPGGIAEPHDPTSEIPQQGTLNKEQRGYVKLLRSSAVQLMTVINDVLDYSKLEAGQMKIERIPFEPMAVVQGSMAAVRQSCVEKGIQLTLKYGETQYTAGGADPFATKKLYSIIPFRIMGDPNRLRQILLNLLSNAIKFTETTGEIHVHVSTYVTESNNSARDLSRHIQFVVTDTGAGIPKYKHATVFQKYQQANTSDARKFGGTGLGLAICQSLADKMGGTIGVDSEV